MGTKYSHSGERGRGGEQLLANKGSKGCIVKILYMVPIGMNRMWRCFINCGTSNDRHSK